MFYVFSVLISVLLISLISLVGVSLIFLKGKISHTFLMRLVGFSSGALLAGVFFNLLPEMFSDEVSVFSLGLILISVLTYLILERFLFWHHCHHEIDCSRHQVRSMGYMNLLGDGLHNFLDGLVVATAYGVSFEIGVITTLVVILHEIPQEFGDFGVLLFSGFKFNQAILFNLVSGLSALLGGTVGIVLIKQVQVIAFYSLPVAIGGFLYIALSDMLPIIREQASKKDFFFTVLSMILGVLAILAVSG